MAKRDIRPEQVRAVLTQPEAVKTVAPGRVVVQALDGGLLLRVFVDVDRRPPAVVTAYRTSKLEKYRRTP
jgi:hypothetical protein